MKVNDVNRLNAMQQYRRNVDTQQGQIHQKRRSKDEVQISNEAKELLGAGKLASERIEQLKESVANGTYHVDARKIAEKLFPHLWQ